MGETKLCSHPFTGRKLSISQISLEWEQSPAEPSAWRTVPLWESMLPCRHTCSRMSSFISMTHIQGLFLSARSIHLCSAQHCQHMHGLELANSEPTGCVCSHWTPWQCSHDLSHPVWGSAKHAEWKTLHCHSPLCFLVVLWGMMWDRERHSCHLLPILTS